jgi:homoserine O-succinyltransferase
MAEIHPFQTASLSVRERVPASLGPAWPAEFAGAVELGLVNNFPDRAMEQAEEQFTGLLERAVAPARLVLRRFTLPGVPRGALGRARIAACYAELEELWSSPPDVVVVTGAEPVAAELIDEPYWPDLAQLLDWAETSGVPLILSCLAAHAATQNLDGIRRRPLGAKRCGVFRHTVHSGHALTQGMAAELFVPHSRWNEVRAKDLAQSSYTVLSMADDGGVDMFVRHGNGPMLFLQGHPEYGPGTLSAEYRRDAIRFLRNERAVYPDMPVNYFTPDAVAELGRFRARALAARSADFVPQFPVLTAQARRPFPAQDNAALLIGNWLRASLPAEALMGAR